MSIERRLERLERSYGSASEEDPAEEARLRAEFAAELARAEAKAAAEEAEGDPRRRIALEQLEKTMKERASWPL